MVPWVCLQFMIVVFPDHTHYFSCQIKNRGHLNDFFLEIQSFFLLMAIQSVCLTITSVLMNESKGGPLIYT